MTITGLIQKSRSIEILSNVYSFLKTEIDSQKSQAIAAGNQAEYVAMLDSFYIDGELSIWKNRSTPFDVQERNAINISYDTVPLDTGSATRNQKAEPNYNIDIVVDYDVENYDESTELLMWMGSIIRGIIQHNDYRRLSTDYVGHRWISNLTPYEPGSTDDSTYLIGGRLSLEATYDEPNLLNVTAGAVEGNDTVIKADENAEYSIKTTF